MESRIEILYELNVGYALLAVLLWGFAALGAGRLALRPSTLVLRRRARLGLVLLAAAVLTVGARAYVAAALSTDGWLLAADFTLVATPPLVLPALAVLGWSLPRYWRLARTPIAEPGTPAPQLRAAAGDPRLTVPVQATAIGAVIGLLVTLHPPVAPYQGDIAVVLGLVALGAAGLWWRHQRRAARLADPGYQRPRWTVRLLRAAAVTGVAALATTGAVWGVAAASRLPDRIPMHHNAALPGAAHAAHPGHGAVSVTDLVRDTDAKPDRRFQLTAQRQRIRLDSGETVHAWTFNGQIPGPELRVREGELVEVELVNRDIASGVTVHWHGIHVPNSADGVAGVTQNAVSPGGRHTYRFRVNQVGTYWYHTHQNAATAVLRGLFGSIVVEPAGGMPEGTVDHTVVAHAWDIGGKARTALNTHTGEQRLDVKPGTPVRLRLVNADNCPRTFALTGTPYRVAAIDGVDLNGSTDIAGTQVRVAGGGRYDLVYRQPAGPVALSVTADANGLPSPFGLNEGCGEDNSYGTAEQGRDTRTDRANRNRLALVTGPTNLPRPAPVPPGPALDPIAYGAPAATPFGPDSDFDRRYDMVFGNSFGFYDGRFAAKWTINNASFPDTPTLVVREGELVKLSFANRSLDDHPMHVHGHHMLVLSRNGRTASGSPWWTDSLNVAPGETYQVAFRADNPGLWMSHCHNLEHTVVGMTLHLAYQGVTTPYEVGRGTPNRHE